MPLNETAKRRPDFRGEPYSVPVTMRDGQTWYVAKPQVRLLPAEDELGFEMVSSVGDPEWDARLNDLHKAVDRSIENEGIDPETGKGWLALRLALFAALIRRNYDLTMAELREILWIENGDTPDPLAEELLAISQGRSGKGRSSGGDALSQSLAD